MGTLSAIAAVMLGAGVLGGVMNFFISEHRDEKPLVWWQHIIVGVGASFMVPLFLNMISSGLIDQIRGTATSIADPAKLFVLAGFCLVAAVSSRAFIQSISERVIRELKETRDVAEDAKEQAAVAVAAAAPLVEADTAETIAATAEAVPALQLTANEAKIARSLATSSYSMRSLSGIAKDTGLDRSTVNATLTSLIEKGMLGQGRNSEGKPRWYLTPAARTHIAPSLANTAA